MAKKYAKTVEKLESLSQKSSINLSGWCFQLLVCDILQVLTIKTAKTVSILGENNNNVEFSI